MNRVIDAFPSDRPTVTPTERGVRRLMGDHE
jgi:hypothetical protein